MHVFIGVLDDDLLVKLPRKSVSEYAIFKSFWAFPQTPLVIAWEAKHYLNLIGN